MNRHRASRSACILLACLASLFTLSMSVVGADEPRVLAFQRPKGGTQEIGLVDENGSNMVILTKGGLHYPEECWSEDGRAIAFTLGNGIVHEICVINADGSGKKQITELGQYSIVCDWSPDGKHILFRTGKNDGWWSLREVHTDTGAIKVITEREPGYRSHWSATGKTIINFSRVAEHELTPAGKKVPVSYVYSPDMRYRITTRADTNGSTTAWISPAAGRPERRLVEIPDMRLHSFAFSSDSQKIAFVAERVFKGECSDGEALPKIPEKRPENGIYTIDFTGRNAKCVAKMAFRPVWRPSQDKETGQQSSAPYRSQPRDVRLQTDGER